MNSIEFGLTCKPYNIKYRDLFGEVPSYSDYACTQEEYLEALQKSVAEKLRIDAFLKRRATPQDPNVLY